MTALFSLELPCVPSPPMSMNEARGAHWRKVRDRVDPWRDATAWVAKQHRKRVHALIAEHGLPLVVRVTLPYKVHRTRDAHNTTSLTIKAIVDGIVLAGWVSDDSERYVEVADPLLVVGGLPKIELLAKPALEDAVDGRVR